MANPLKSSSFQGCPHRGKIEMGLVYRPIGLHEKQWF
jgi:hypothetical protein